MSASSSVTVLTADQAWEHFSALPDDKLATVVQLIGLDASPAWRSYLNGDCNRAAMLEAMHKPIIARLKF